MASTEATEFPSPLPNMPDIYSSTARTCEISHYLVCASCGSSGHDENDFEINDPCLDCLSISRDTYVSFDFSTGFTPLDSRRIMVSKAGIVDDGKRLLLCNTCHKAIVARNIPDRTLSNFCGAGDVPKELRDLNCLEELLVARAHVVGRIVRIEESKASSYFALKGHILLLPQDTTLLIDLLPISSLPEII